jgi:hypothetical protein
MYSIKRVYIFVAIAAGVSFRPGRFEPDERDINTFDAAHPNTVLVPVDAL